MKIDGGIGFDPSRRSRDRPGAEELGLRRRLVGRDRPRPVPPAGHRGRGDRAPRARHLHRGGLRPEPDEPGRSWPTTSSCCPQGRFILGLGSQIKPHITKRYSMQWSHPAARMRELLARHPGHLGQLGRRATKLDFRGEFYTHTLMTPFFNPGPNPYGNPKIILAAVGELHDRGGRRGRATA